MVPKALLGAGPGYRWSEMAEMEVVVDAGVGGAGRGECAEVETE